MSQRDAQRNIEVAMPSLNFVLARPSDALRRHGASNGDNLRCHGPVRMSLVQQFRSIVIHGFRLALFLSADRNAFNVSYVASAIILALIGSLLPGLPFFLICANHPPDRLTHLLPPP